MASAGAVRAVSLGRTRAATGERAHRPRCALATPGPHGISHLGSTGNRAYVRIAREAGGIIPSLTPFHGRVLLNGTVSADADSRAPTAHGDADCLRGPGCPLMSAGRSPSDAPLCLHSTPDAPPRGILTSRL